MKHLLMISYPFPPNASAGAVRSERFARHLANYDWSVSVITIKPRRDIFEDRTRVEALGKNVNVHFTNTLDPWLWLKDKRTNNIFLKVVRSILMKLFSFPDHMLLWVAFAVRSGLAICKREKVDAIYTTSPPHSTHLAGLILSYLSRKPWLTDFRDPWTLNAYRRKGFLDDALFKIEKILEKMVLKKASIILANTKANRHNLLQAFPRLIPDKVIHLPNGWEDFPERYHREKKNGPFTIVHTGTFYPRFKPYGLLYALAAWKNGEHPSDVPPLEKENIQIILLGSRDAETKRVVQDLEIDDIVDIKPWVSLKAAHRIMCQSDLLWTSLGTGIESSTYVPSKLFEYIAAKRPIIGFFPDGEAANLIRETETGIVFTSDDPAPVIKFLYEICLNNKHKIDPAHIFRRHEDVIAFYNIRVIADKFANILNQLT